MDEKVIAKYKKAGEIAKKVKEKGYELVKEGSSFLAIGDELEKLIYDLGAKPGFPVHLSINENAAHDIPRIKDPRIFQKGDLVKIDIGVHVGGYLADTAITKEVGTDKFKDLINASNDAVKAGVDSVKIGVKVTEIGKAIQEAIKKYDLVPITNLGGHLLEKYIIHGGCTIPNFNSGSDRVLEKGMAIAIEPFATNGIGRVIEGRASETFSLEEPKPVRSPFARRILEHIETRFLTLPFAKRWLLKKFNHLIIESGMHELTRLDILHNYPILKEESNGMVSQAEHTVLVLDSPIVTTK